MVLIRFPDQATERRALGFLAGRFSFRSWADGLTLVPEQALGALAMEGIRFIVEGPPTYARSLPALRNPPAATV